VKGKKGKGKGRRDRERGRANDREWREYDPLDNSPVLAGLRLTFFFCYTLQHLLKRPLNPSSPNRETRCMPGVLRKLGRDFSVSGPIVNFSSKYKNFSRNSQVQVAHYQTSFTVYNQIKIINHGTGLDLSCFSIYFQFVFSLIFTARRVCIARTMPWQDVCHVCPSVCLIVTCQYCV